ncbi:uncharacterized protein [Argopecten irradians]|uniref:uncharacterized protein n=1 Tax=Argopecten irradians TaxID=31199 RepID=UPI0037205FFB
MKFTLVFPDKKRKTIRLGERQGVKTLLKHLPNGTTIKHPRRDTKVCGHKRRLLGKTFNDGDILNIVYKDHTSVRRLRRDLPTSNEECMISLSKDSKRAKMPCGHAITPRSLFDYCWSQLENGRTEIKCPYVLNAKAETCNSLWLLDVITKFANMNKEEKKTIENKIFTNKMKITNQKIPDVNTMISLLHKCPTKLIQGISCPIRRACPNCYSIIEHTGGCRSMCCEYPGCGYVFCFRCLSERARCKFKCKTVPKQFALL